MKTTTALLAFNRGLMSRLALARIDLKRSALSAEEQTNWMPRVLGSMALRPGLEYLGTSYQNAPSKFVPFVYANDDTALLELNQSYARVWTGDPLAPITYPAVTTTLDDFPAWTDASDVGAVVDTSPIGSVRLTGTGAGAARIHRLCSVAGGDVGVEHAIQFRVTRGAVRLRVGTSPGAVDYVDVTMTPGFYSMAFTPAGDFYVDLSAKLTYRSEVFLYIGSTFLYGICPGGPLLLENSWPSSALDSVRWAQSGDVVFTAGEAPLSTTRELRRFARYGPRSWAVEFYRPADGPFDPPNLGPITVTPSALTGNVTLTASEALFTTRHRGALFKITSQGQSVAANLSGADQYTNPIRVFGVGASRAFSVTVSGTWSATVTLQRSVGAPGDWTSFETYTSNQSKSVNDGLDNIEVYYRIGIKTGEHTSGTAAARLDYAAGGITGVARITSTLSSTPVAGCSAEVLSPFGGTAASTDWAVGAWSHGRGYPTAVAFHEGRLWWAGRDRIWGSVSDDFTSFDETIEGDAGPISRSLGSGPVDTVNWLLPLQQLLAGTPGREITARSSSFDEPLTPTAFRLTTTSTQGSAEVAPVEVDTAGVFVQRNGNRVYELVYDGGSLSYASRELTSVVPEIGAPGVVRLAAQRQPDTRIHCVRSDGKVAILVFDPTEEVNCWVLFETSGAVEDVVVLPGEEEDQVFYLVRRIVNGNTVRYLERWSLEEEGRGAAVTKLADASTTYTGAATTAVTGLSHLEGETVSVWADGADLGTFTVSSGQITLPEAKTNVTVGLPYTARFRSTKLAYTLQDGRVSLCQRQRLDHVGLVLADTHIRGLRVGQDFDHLEDLPVLEHGSAASADTIYASYSEDSVPVNGRWDTDARLCLEAASPRPCTILAAVVELETNFK